MVRDITQYVSKIDETDLFIASVLLPSATIDDIRIVSRSRLKFLFNLKLSSFYDGLRFIFKYNLPLKARIKTLYTFACTGQVSSIVSKYDLVHIHGCTPLTAAVINICKRKNVPLLITLHGLNSFEDSIKVHHSLKQYERDFLLDSVKGNYSISFISSGNKNVAEKYVHDVLGKNLSCPFFVISNGCDIALKQKVFDVRDKYGIDQNDFVYLCVGNISENKNQLQVARAWSLLSEDEKIHSKILFVGRYSQSDAIFEYIKDNHLESRLILCGMQPKNMLGDYYSASDATILASKTEGFGLSIIEGFVYGKPNITFADLPAVVDLYNEDAMILSPNRSDMSLSQAMTKAITIHFDPKKIRLHSKLFSFEEMAIKYDELFNKIIQR